MMMMINLAMFIERDFWNMITLIMLTCDIIKRLSLYFLQMFI